MKNLTDTDYQHALCVKTLLREKFGDLIYQIYCYGSRVSRQTQDTDFDLLILTTEKIDWRMEDEIYSVIFNYGVDNDILFDVRYFSKEEFDNIYRNMPFITEVKSYGIAV
ncbi:MAG: hypothetical protein WCJ01_11975 [Ignavibacteria bacterium]